MPRVSPVVILTPEQRSNLERIVRCGKTEQRIVVRAKILLGCSVDGYRADLWRSHWGYITTVESVNPRLVMVALLSGVAE